MHMEKVSEKKPDLFMVGHKETCWFCNVREPRDSAVYKFHMNRRVGKEDEVITAHAVRCRNCKKMHFQQHLFTWVVFIGLCYFSFLLLDFRGSRKLYSILIFISWSLLIFKPFWSNYIIVWFSKKVRIHSTRTKDLRKHPEIGQRLSTGWGFGQPSI